MKQITDTVLMIRPKYFRTNEQTAVNNYYQNTLSTLPLEATTTLAQREFDAYVDALRHVGVNVVVVNDTDAFDTPDALFPNNWISFHEDGRVALYPMFAENRRLERRNKQKILGALQSAGFMVRQTVDYSYGEASQHFLEGTGSLLLDRVHKKAYCSLSPRTHEALLATFCKDFGYQPIVFGSKQTVGNTRKAIYHTNVMMCLGETFAVICLDSIDNPTARENVVTHLNDSGKAIIAITEAQVKAFAGNMLQVKGLCGKRYLLMSCSAHRSLTITQLKALETHANILPIPLDTIETHGGGSARCMIAEIFLPKTPL